jgi:hypothetical protein
MAELGNQVSLVPDPLGWSTGSQFDIRIISPIGRCDGHASVFRVQS